DRQVRDFAGTMLRATGPEDRHIGRARCRFRPSGPARPIVGARTPDLTVGAISCRPSGPPHLLTTHHSPTLNFEPLTLFGDLTMTTTSIHSPKPRRRSAPSARDQQIYLDYQTTGRSQEELAEQYHLTQCRISQIIHCVEAWLACGAGVSPADESAAIQNPKSEIQNQITADSADLDRALQRQYLAF